MSKRFGFLVAIAAAIMIASPASADVFSSYSCNTSLSDCSGSAAVSGGNFDLQSSTTGPVGASGLQFTPSGTLTVSQLTDLSANYDMVTGSFTGGAPRFTLFDASNNAAYIYWGTPTGGGSFTNANSNGVFGDTGNYVNSSDLRVYSNGFGGDNNPNSGVSFATFESLVGATAISSIYLDLDAGFAGNQELLVSSFTVNSSVDTPATTNVPEPFTLSLFGAGFAGLTAMRRRKARKA